MVNYPNPPLLGDRQGRYRVLVVGNSGVGKSTLSAALAQKLHVAYIALDRLNWRPGWQETPAAELRALVEEAIDRNPHGWVTDGNYTSKIGGLVQDQTTDIIWLDPPLVLYFSRIFVRTIRRWLGLEEFCSPGCGETLRSIFFSSDSILWWCLSHHFVVRRRCGEMMSQIGLGIGPDTTANRMQRIGGWGGELKSWWERINILVREKKA